MIVDSISLNLIRLPFRFSYGHKRKTHSEVYSVICQIDDGEGHTGLGEAVPRNYVTGETAQSAFRDAERLGRKLLGRRFSSFRDIQDSMKGLSTEWSDPLPSCAFATLDLALHDCLAVSKRQDMGTYFGVQSKPVSYTASIGFSSKAKLLALLSVYRLSGIRAFKLKVGDEHDASRLQTIKNVMGNDVSVYADANGAWSEAEARAKIEALAGLGVWGIEEPLHIPMPTGEADDAQQLDREGSMPRNHFERYAKLRSGISIPLILDESLISPNSYQRIVEIGAADILNIRLSKLGGHSLASTMVENKPDALRIGIGAMVGESPILAAAGYFFACAHPDRLFVQGYSHRLLHGSSFTEGGPAMNLGRVAASKKTPGIGVKLNRAALDRLTIKKRILKHEKE